MMPPPIQLHVTAWQDALEMNVLYSVQASPIVVLEWENLPMIHPRIPSSVHVIQDVMEMTVPGFLVNLLEVFK